MRQAFWCMGMPMSIDTPQAPNDTALCAAMAELRAADERFSPFKETSELTRFQTGQLPQGELSPDMRAVMQACQDWQRRTDGYFSAHFAGMFDPTGYVKGWAIARAGARLEALGCHTYMINAGGDILARSQGEHVWRVGLQHPTDPQAVAGTLTLRNGAVATSGTYARGRHIVNPHSGEAAVCFLSATVVGPDIATADALATTLCAMGEAGPAFVQKQAGYQALAVRPDLSAVQTPGFGAVSI